MSLRIEGDSRGTIGGRYRPDGNFLEGARVESLDLILVLDVDVNVALVVRGGRFGAAVEFERSHDLVRIDVDHSHVLTFSVTSEDSVRGLVVENRIRPCANRDRAQHLQSL